MTPNCVWNNFHSAYVRTVAARAGFQVTRPEPDVDSVDGIILSTTGRRPKIDFQAKATTQDMLRHGMVHFPLPVKNYNDLRAETISPRILVVFLMPSDSHDWTAQTEEELCIRYCAYWNCLEGQPERHNTNNITVQLPTSNILSANQLNEMMVRVNRGESLC